MNKILTMVVLVAAGCAVLSGCDRAEDTVSTDVPDVLTAIATRKSVRKFDATKPVEDEKVEKILKAAMCAPSAMDKRPWEFVVVKNKWNPAKVHPDKW